MPAINAFFSQSVALLTVRTLFSAPENAGSTTAEAAIRDIVATTSKIVPSTRSNVSPAVGDALLTLRSSGEADQGEDSMLPPGWTKWGSPGVRGWENVEDIEDPEMRALYTRIEETRPIRKAQGEMAMAIRDTYGADSIEYKNHLENTRVSWSQTDLRMAKLNYDRAKTWLESGTYAQNVLVDTGKGHNAALRDENGEFVLEYKPLTKQQTQWAETIVSEYSAKMEDLIAKVTASYNRGLRVSGDIMVKDDSGEYQWSAFKVFNPATGNVYLEHNGNGILTMHDNDRSVLREERLR